MGYVDGLVWKCPKPGCEEVEIISSSGVLIDDHVASHHRVGGPLPIWSCPACPRVLYGFHADDEDWEFRARQHAETHNNPEVAGRVGGAGEAVNHPAHYGGDTPYEAIKVIEAWGLGFALGNAVKYIARAGRKGDRLEDLRKAKWYLEYEIKREEDK